MSSCCEAAFYDLTGAQGGDCRYKSFQEQSQRELGSSVASQSAGQRRLEGIFIQGFVPASSLIMLVLLVAVTLLLATHIPYVKMTVTSLEAMLFDWISELLRPEECHKLYILLSLQQREARGRFEEKRLFSYGLWQDIANLGHCRELLNRWLHKGNGNVHWDHVVRALRLIERHDITRELMKRLTKNNRSLEHQWNTDETLTLGGTPASALLSEHKQAHHERSSSQISNGKYSERVLEKGTWGLFLKMFPESWQNLMQFIAPAIRIIIIGILTAEVAWLLCVYYFVCWHLGQCLFADGARYNNQPVRRNMNITGFWSDQSSEESVDEQEAPGTS